MPHRYELTREIFEDTICYILNTTKKKLGNELLNEGMSPTMNPQFYNECQKIHQINTRMIIEGKDLSDLINFLIEEPYNLDTKKGSSIYSIRKGVISTIYEEILFERKKMNYKNIGYKNIRDHQKREEKFKAFYDTFEIGAYKENKLNKIKEQLNQVSKYDPKKDIRDKAQELIIKIVSKHSLGQISLTDPNTQGALSQTIPTGALSEPWEQPQEPSWYQRFRGMFN